MLVVSCYRIKTHVMIFSNPIIHLVYTNKSHVHYCIIISRNIFSCHTLIKYYLLFCKWSWGVWANYQLLHLVHTIKGTLDSKTHFQTNTLYCNDIFKNVKKNQSKVCARSRVNFLAKKWKCFPLFSKFVTFDLKIWST
jgi:hypothetical protein